MYFSTALAQYDKGRTFPMYFTCPSNIIAILLELLLSHNNIAKLHLCAFCPSRKPRPIQGPWGLQLQDKWQKTSRRANGYRYVQAYLLDQCVVQLNIPMGHALYLASCFSEPKDKSRVYCTYTWQIALATIIVLSTIILLIWLFLSYIVVCLFGCCYALFSHD